MTKGSWEEDIQNSLFANACSGSQTERLASRQIITCFLRVRAQPTFRIKFHGFSYVLGAQGRCQRIRADYGLVTVSLISLA